MADRVREQTTYLWVAETILRKHRRPLRARQIVNFGLDDGLFADMDLSKTPQKSMQSRLSMDIINKHSNSIFMRTGRGKFFLREMHRQSQGKSKYKFIPAEYKAVRRAPTMPSENVLSIPISEYASILDFQGINLSYDLILDKLLASPGLTYIPRTEAETNSEYKQFVTYTIIQQREKVLSFRRGQYNRAASFLRGARCIGFGGHVTEDDISIFSHGDRGIRANAAREIAEEITLANGRPQIDPSDFEVIGFLNDDSSDVGVRHVGVILRYWAPEKPEWDNPLRGEASVSQLKWLNTSASTIDLLEFEYWSQLSLRTLFPAFLSSRPAYKIIRPSAFTEDHLLCITGSIGSGKSITTNRLCAQAGYRQVNTGHILASILKIPPVPMTERTEFQSKALEFIRSKDGPKKLAEAISTEVASIDTPRIIIDGIRQLETLEILKSITSIKVATVFVHTPPDIAYRLYSIREAPKTNISLSEFMKIYNAPVESEVRLIIQEADAIIYNWFGLDNYEILVENLIDKLGLRPL